MTDDERVLNRWRLVLGKFAKTQIDYTQDSNEIHYMDMEEALEYIYGREYGDMEESGGGSGRSSLTVPEWISKIKKLFPKETVEIMEHHALDRYGMNELITDPEVLGELEPDRELLKTILSFKNLMSGEVLDMAKKIVAKVAAQISEELETEVKKSCIGKIDRTRQQCQEYA